MNTRDDKVIRQYHELVLERSRRGSPRRPTFIGIGEGRCGTTSIAAWLGKHPDVYMSPVKEIKFFSQTGQFANKGKGRGITFREYLNYFMFAGDQKHVGEISPQYIGSSDAIEKIYELLPDVKIIITLRNPVQRFFSLYKYHNEFHRYADIANYVEDAFSLLDKPDQPFFSPAVNLRRSLCADKVSHVQSLFGRDNTLVLFFEDLVADVDGYKKRLARFLDIEDRGTAFPKVNASRKSESLPEYIADRLREFYREDTGQLEKLDVQLPEGYRD